MLSASIVLIDFSRRLEKPLYINRNNNSMMNHEISENMIILTLLLIIYVSQSYSLICGTYCNNYASGAYTAVYVEASISGVDPGTSAGWCFARGEYTTIFGDQFCAWGGYMSVELGCQYNYVIYFGAIDRTYSEDFSPAGSYTYAEILRNYCDGIETAVAARLSCGCIK